MVRTEFFRAVGCAATPDDDTEYKIASTTRERIEAFRLAHRAYVRRGLSRPNRFRMRITPFHLLPGTMQFVATRCGRVISTMSLVVDNHDGLPMESMYPEVIRERRQNGLLVGEVTCLAHELMGHRESIEVFVALGRMMAQYALRQGLDQLLIACHPHHAPFYRRKMCFDPIGWRTVCPHVENHPAVALCLDFRRASQDRPALYRRFFGDRISAARLRPQPIGTLLRECLRRMVDPSFRPRSSKPARQSLRRFIEHEVRLLVDVA